MSFYFHPDAETELSHAVAYYEELQKDLGLAFAQEIFDTIQRIIEFPEAWQPITTKSRRCLTNRFPFGVIYQIQEDAIVIIAVMHLHKEPNYWKNRK